MRQLPGPDELRWLSRRQDPAVSLYVVTDALNTSGAKAFRAADDAVGRALARAGNSGAGGTQLVRLRHNWDALAENEQPWTGKSMAAFLCEAFAVAYPLPDRVRPAVDVGDRFVLGQLLRSVTAPFGAYALTLTEASWQLWWGTSTSTASEVPGAGGASERWRQLLGDLIEPLADDLLDGYLAEVGEAVTTELDRLDPGRSRALLLFAESTLADAFQTHPAPAPLELVPGAADGLTRGPIARALRQRSKSHGRARQASIVERCRPLLLNGLAVDDWPHVRRAAAAGAVRTLLFDHATAPAEAAIEALRTGAEVLPLTPSELAAAGWPGTVLAELRHPVA